MANINRFAISPCILIAPLDWGLGHATRCIPVIRELLSAGAKVIIAADGPVASLLHLEFPAIEIIPLAGYRIWWPGKIKSLIWLLKEFKRIKKVIKNEHEWLDKIIDEKSREVRENRRERKR